MNQREPDHIWWRWIANPHSFENVITEALLSQNAVILAGRLPWADYLRKTITAKMQEQSVIAAILDAPSVGDEDFAEFLLKYFGSADLADNYRPPFSPPLAEYLAQNEVLADKLVWIRDASAEQTARWTDFLKRYKTKSIWDGLFVVECSDPKQAYSGDRLKFFNFSQFLDFYDVLSFSMLLVSSGGANKIAKQYAAWAAAFCFQNDVELLARFMAGDADERLDDASQDREELLSAVMAFFASAGIPADQKRIATYLWQAQMQVFFPLIERLRTKLIAKYYDRILDVLQTNDVDWYGEKIENPYDAELGLLKYLSRQFQPDGRSRVLYFPSSDDYQNLMFLHECRNTLAHLGILDNAAIDRIITQDADFTP
jgi:hypothetical protein